MTLGLANRQLPSRSVLEPLRLTPLPSAPAPSQRVISQGDVTRAANVGGSRGQRGPTASFAAPRLTSLIVLPAASVAVVRRRRGSGASSCRQLLSSHTSVVARRATEAAVKADSLDEAQETADGEESGEQEGEAATEAKNDSMVSPFDKDGVAGAEKPKLPLTWENVEAVLDEVRPYLRNDGGDCKIVEIDGPIVRLELQGSCSSCSASSVTLKMGIEKTLAERIPEIAEVVAVMPDQEPLTEEGIEEVLNGIRPFLSVSGGSIAKKEFLDGDNPRIVLTMTGPPLKSMAVRVEVVNRMKRKYPQVQDVDIVGEDEDSESDEDSDDEESDDSDDDEPRSL
mmetsp:Transcript_133184/g.332510  ORF Transcript_133184/g.332510 Transcript_133184/m.332510 type:complete len:340 (-) Transcript_133184:49-1068(-)